MNDDNLHNQNVESEDYSVNDFDEEADNHYSASSHAASEEEYMPEEVNSKPTSFQKYQERQNRLQAEAERLEARKRLLNNPYNRKKKGSEDDSEDKPSEETSGLTKNEESDGASSENKKESNDTEQSSKVKSKLNAAQGKINDAKIKLNKAKQTANKVAHPINATKEQVKDKIKKKIITFLLHWWWVIAIVVVLLLILLIILLILLGMDDDESDYAMIDPTYDISQTMVTITNDYQSEADKIVIDRVTLMDYALGAAYAEFYNKLDDKSSSEKSEIYKAFFIVHKSILLSLGNYDSETKEITIKDGLHGVPYCDINAGCKIINNNGYYTYVPANSSLNVPGALVSEIGPISSSEKSILVSAYNETATLLLTPKSFNSPLTKYDFARPDYNPNIRDSWISSSAKYDKKISNTPNYIDFKIYDLKDYTFSYSYASSSGYWWPIGSTNATNGKIYGGAPSTTYVSSKYGPRTVQGVSGYHTGLDIADSGCSKNVIIATRAGTVIEAKDGCDSTGYYGNTCNGGNGNYVKIDHGDGIVSVYAHMTKGSIVVSVGQTVAQGEKLGLMGSSGSSTGCHLHFGIYVNGSHTDPLQYISSSNPRPSDTVSSSYQQGGNTKQSVCLTLKSSGFSDNAVAAIMANIQQESSFRTDALGDNGTSYGLCQWHNGRFTSLKSYCGSEFSTVKCQMSYLIHELSTVSSYKGVYNKLLSNSTANDMATYYCINFEVPADRYNHCPQRANNYAGPMLSYVTNGCK